MGSIGQETCITFADVKGNLWEARSVDKVF